MKKIIYICLALLCIAALVACNGRQPTPEPELDQETTPGELSDDLDSFMFSLNGVVYTLPVPIAQLMANGWAGHEFELESRTIYPSRDC